MEWKAFPLHPETPQEGRSLEELFAGSNINIPQMLDHLKNVADSLGLPFGTRTKTYNSRLAQELGLWAEVKGKGDEFHHGSFHAYFAEGRNLAELEVLQDIAEKAGLDGNEAKEVITTRSFAEAVDEHWTLSRVKGVTAVPTFIMNNGMLTGARPYQDLVNFIKESGAKDA